MRKRVREILEYLSEKHYVSVPEIIKDLNFMENTSSNIHEFLNRYIDIGLAVSKKKGKSPLYKLDKREGIIQVLGELFKENKKLFAESLEAHRGRNKYFNKLEGIKNTWWFKLFGRRFK